MSDSASKKIENLHALSFDPGDTNGWAAWDEAGECIGWGSLKGEAELYPFLYEQRAKLYIVEAFELYPWKNQRAEFSWNSFNTSQRIGAIKFVAFLQGAPVVEQKAAIKKVAYMQAGLGAAPSNKAAEHPMDALVHGYWYFVHTAKKRPIGPLFRKAE